MKHAKGLEAKLSNLENTLLKVIWESTYLIGQMAYIAIEVENREKYLVNDVFVLFSFDF